jgi:hypothetical protein
MTHALQWQQVARVQLFTETGTTQQRHATIVVFRVHNSPKNLG